MRKTQGRLRAVYANEYLQRISGMHEEEITLAWQKLKDLQKYINPLIKVI